MTEPILIIIEPIDDDWAKLTINPSDPSEINTTINNDPDLLPFHLADYGLMMYSQIPVPRGDGTYELTVYRAS